jgi:hypothetical protein
VVYRGTGRERGAGPLDAARRGWVAALPAGMGRGFCIHLTELSVPPPAGSRNLVATANGLATTGSR